MSQSCSCPVCGRQGLPADCARCPQCDSDLTCFQVLDSLSFSKAAPDAPPAQKKSRRFPWLAVLSGTGLVLLLAVLAAAWKNRLPELTALFSQPQAAQDQQTALPLHEEAGKLSDGKIHIDAQIRILDDRQEREKRQAAQQSIAIEEKNKADSAAQEESRQAAPDDEPSDVPAAQESVASGLLEQTEQDDEDRRSSESHAVELSETAAKEVADAASAADQQRAEIAVLPTELPVLQGRRKRAVRTISVSGLHQVDADYAKNKNKSTMVHHAQDGETVWELAERFYGEGKYYPVIMELNPQILQGRVRGGGNVRLLADRRQAAALYQRSTEQRDSLLLWKHKVQPGETWQSIYLRFFPPKYSGMVFYPGDQKVVPGSTVRIILR